MPRRGTSPSTPSKSFYPVVVLGTRAQLIKMAPVLREMEARELPYRLVLTGQHLITIQDLLDEFGIRTKPEWLSAGTEIDTVGKMAPWFLAALWRLAFIQRKLLRAPQGKSSLIVVHGDTVSTLLGALAGRLNRCTVAHIESGLRSFSLVEPFPEELTRVFVFHLIDVAFCPGQWAAANMKNYNAAIIDTTANTLIDTVRIAKNQVGEFPHTDVGKPYCVVSIHRFENLRSSQRISSLVRVLLEIAESHEIRFVLHPATRIRLQSSGQLEKLSSNEAIHLIDRMGYLDFLSLLVGADFVLTDGGSNQEELSYLAIPTLIARNRSERQEGLHGNAELLTLGRDYWRDVLHTIKQRNTSNEDIQKMISPSTSIVDWIEAQVQVGGR